MGLYIVQKFEEELKNHQEHVDKIKSLAEEILSSCHPNAVRFVKYYLTITQTRWEQVHTFMHLPLTGCLSFCLYVCVCVSLSHSIFYTGF